MRNAPSRHTSPPFGSLTAFQKSNSLKTDGHIFSIDDIPHPTPLTTLDESSLCENRVETHESNLVSRQASILAALETKPDGALDSDRKDTTKTEKEAETRPGPESYKNQAAISFLSRLLLELHAKQSALLAVLAVIIVPLALWVGLLQGMDPQQEINGLNTIFVTIITLLVSSVIFLALRRADSVDGSRALFLAALEADEEGRLLITDKGEILYSNANFNWLCGVSREDSIQSLSALAERVPKICSAFQHLSETQKSKELCDSTPVSCMLPLSELRGEQTDLNFNQPIEKNKNWYQLTIKRLTGHPETQLWILSDQTAQQIQIAQIKAERDDLADFFEKVPISLFSLDPLGRFQRVNQAAANLFGVSAAMLRQQGATLRDFLKNPCPINILNKQGSVLLQPYNGETIATWLGQTVRRHTSGRPVATRSYLQPLTREELIQNHPVKSDDRYHRIFESIVDGLIEINGHGRISGCNIAMRSLIKPYPHPLVRKYVTELIAPEDRALFADGIVALMMKSEESPIELCLIGNSNSTVLMTLTVLDDEANDPEHHLYLVQFTDVSNVRKLERQMAQAQTMKQIGQFTAGIAHDVNNMQHVVIGHCEQAKAGMRADDPQLREVMAIWDTSKRCVALVSSLLAYSRQRPRCPKIIVVEQAFADMRAMIQKMIGNDIELLVKIAMPLKRIEADDNELVQIFTNLALNARDAIHARTEPGLRRLEITMENIEQRWKRHCVNGILPAGEYIKITIRDTGIGMTDEVFEKLFELRFSTKKDDNYGVGLATVHGIISQLDGGIEVESKRGVGTCFTVFF